MTGEMRRGVWVTYSAKFGQNFSPTDWEPTTYYNVAVFDDEMAALRHANELGCRAVHVKMGQTLADAVNGRHNLVAGDE